MPSPSAPQSQSKEAATLEGSSKHFTFELGSDGEKIVKFHDVKAQDANAIPLTLVVRQMVPNSTPGRLHTLKALYLVLGKFRSIQLTLKQSNDLLSKSTSADDPNSDSGPPTGYARYVRYHMLNLCSVLGFAVPKPRDPITVPGLDDLVSAVEAAYAQEIVDYRDTIKRGYVSLDGLAELYVPGINVSGATGLAGTRSCFYVRNCHFEERRSLFGIEKVFKFQLEFVASFGKDYVVMAFEDLLAGWTGTKTRPLQDLPYEPLLTESSLLPFHNRGIRYVSLTSKSPNFVQYRPDGFFPHHSAKLRPSTVSTSSSGRIMVDIERGATEGHHASQGSDQATNALIVTAGRYKRIANEGNNGKGGSAPSSSTDALLTLNELPTELYALTWPAVVGFSFASKAWGHALVDWLEPIKFNATAFDQLVLAPERKRLIRALVKFGDGGFEDVVAGKSGGSVFLLHGAPGTGKTLTAGNEIARIARMVFRERCGYLTRRLHLTEAIAEVLQRPLYYVTMGELGVTPEDLERRLSAVLDLCAGWNALVLIDEADVFLEKRATQDVLRNAMVCVMLRLVEYHQGILFLTTNRVKNFDPALESRVTVALRYDELTPSARVQVWENLLSRIPKGMAGRPGLNVDDSVDTRKLGEHKLNGRQIKNAIRLALALAEEEGSGVLTMATIQQTIDIMSIGRDEMATAGEY
ncbi:hypothetical protein HDU93_001986 [Gonapodya sp. JEL0774]|nr:hypothetical protein HDU93_001986 [Gonapodya sp. JEL0774]